MASGSMRLRIRAAGGGATLRVQVPAAGTLYDLRHAVSQMIGAPADSIRLSLNKRDDIVEGAATAPLETYGIRPGDLLYYLDRDLGLEDPSSSEQATAMEVERRELCAAAADKRARQQNGALEEESSLTRSRIEVQNGALGEESSLTRSRIEVSPAGPMEEEAVVDRNTGKEQVVEQGEMEEKEEGEVEPEDCGKKYCHLIPSLLSRLLAVEGPMLENSQDLLILAIHAVMLETGFMPLESRIIGVSSLRYSLPDLGEKNLAIVLLRCQRVGDFIVVYGSVSGSSQVSRLSLSISKFLGDAKLESKQEHGQDLLSIFKDAFALWKVIKDGLTLRLLTLLCEIVGLPLPACFQILPTELKMRILELLSAVDLARISLVSSELRFLAGNEDLWRAKFLSEMFKPRQGGELPGCWKTAFVREWYARKRRERVQQLIVPARPRPHHPWILGGDYDIFPFHRGGAVINPFGGPRFRRPLNPGCIGAASSGIGSGAMEITPELPRPGENHHPPLRLDLPGSSSIGDVDMDDII